MLWLVTMNELFEYALSPYTDLLGFLFFPIVYIKIIRAILVRTRSSALAGAVTLATLPIAVFTVPKQFHPFIYALIAFGILAIVYPLIRGRVYE